MPKNTIIDSTDFSYNAAVKARLIAWKEEFETAMCAGNLNFAGISEALLNCYNISVHTTTLREMFSPRSDRELRLDIVIALADLFSIPLWDLLYYPPEQIKKRDTKLTRLVKGTSLPKDGIQRLVSPFYCEDYYCYYFDQKARDLPFKPLDAASIVEAKLSIQLINNQTMVTFTEHKTSTTFGGDPLPEFTLRGQLIILENSSIAYCLLLDDESRRCISLMFQFLRVSNDIRYFVPAGMQTFSLNQIHQPMYQKMAMFRVQQDIHDSENIDLLKGILALNDSPMVLDAETLEALRKDKTFKKLLSNPKLENCSVFSENTIFSNADFMTDENELAQAMLTLRRKSLYPAHEIISEQEGFINFIKDFQMQHKNYPAYLAEMKNRS